MNKAKFYKVSLERFKNDKANTHVNEEFTKEIAEAVFNDAVVKSYNNLKLPKRATKGSAGYDFFAPFNIDIHPGKTVTIPTGIRCEMNPSWVLMLFPRSGLGFKYRMQLNNTVGIIDSDYFFSDNEGHIMVKITNDTNENKTIHIEEGKAFVQGIFVQYGITEDDEATETRNGGFGSTDKN